MGAQGPADWPPGMVLPRSIVPEPEILHQKALELRKLFNVKYEDKIISGAYDPRDLERFTNDELYAQSFLTMAKTKGDIAKACDAVNDAFDFRKETGIWDWTDEMFPQSLWQGKAIFYHGRDKKGHPILQIRTTKTTSKTAEEMQYMKRFIAWQFEKHHREMAGRERCAVFLDMHGAGLANLNMDLSKYLVKLFQLFPSYAIYVLNFEMHWLLCAFWRAICLFLNEDQRRLIILAGKKELKLYIPDEHLLDHQK